VQVDRLEVGGEEGYEEYRVTAKKTWVENWLARAKETSCSSYP
jgi:hypothetical protein